MGIFNSKKKIEKFDIARERERFSEMRYNQNENNINIKERFIDFLERIKKQSYEEVKGKVFGIIFESHEFKNCNVEYEWFKEVANLIIGNCEIIGYSRNDNPNTMIIEIRKI